MVNNIEDNYFKYYDEYYDILFKMNKVKNNKKVKLKGFSSYLKYFLLGFLFFYMLVILLLVFSNVSDKVANDIMFVLSLLIFVFIVTLISYYIFFDYNKNIVNRDVSFNEDGIKGLYSNRVVKWKDVSYVVIGMNVLLFGLSLDKKHFFIPIIDRDDYKKKLMKYKKTIFIYEVK